MNLPFPDLMEKWFGRWEDCMTSILTSFIIVIGVLILVGCCIIPCVRGLIETALTKQPPQPYQNNLFLLKEQEHKIQKFLNEFEEKNLNFTKGGNCKKNYHSSVFVTPSDYLKILQVAILSDLHV
jgi:hypothetical protein